MSPFCHRSKHLSGGVIGKDEELATKRDIPSDGVGDINQVRDLRTARS